MQRSPFPRLARVLSGFCWLLSATFAGAAPAAAASTPPAQATDHVRILATVTDGFRHPGIGFTQEILENARAQVLAKREPWYSGFVRLAAHRDSALVVSIRNESKARPGWPDVDAFDSRGIEARLKQDGAKAKRQALMYFFTGEPAYRANALRILRVWSRMDPAKYRNYVEAHIHASYPVQDIIIAAELVRYTEASTPSLAWTDDDTRSFTANLLVPAISTFLDGNGWFMNQSGYPMAASMAGDIFTNNRTSYAKRVEWFTINKTAPNKGWSYSIQDLARLVDRNAITGEATTPRVQLLEMGRDQAHAGGDVEIFGNIARMMNAQGTRVDPVAGTISTASNAVGPYEFLGDRILAATDYLCRFMLGYDTPWTPVAYDIAPDGVVRGIYPRIADNYRGRIRGFDFWDAYEYYAFRKGVDVSTIAPFYHEAYTKRIINSDTDWVFLPANASGDALRVAPTEQQPAVVEIEQRSTQFDTAASVVSEDGLAFVRVIPAEAGTRIALLSMDTDAKRVALRYRSNGAATVRLSGIAAPWVLPNTQGAWRVATHDVGPLERFRDIVFTDIKAPKGTRIDLDSLQRLGAEALSPLAEPAATSEVVVYVGAPLRLAFPAKTGGTAVSAEGLPETAALDASTGTLSWTPATSGERNLIITHTAGERIEAHPVRILVEADRAAAIERVLASRPADVAYLASSVARRDQALSDIRSLPGTTSDHDYLAKLSALQFAVAALQPLSPRLADGSLDFPGLVETSDIGPAIGLLTDRNDDTFPVLTLAKDLNYIFDFGPRFRVSASAFAIEGRLNFEARSLDVVYFASENGTTWTPLTAALKTLPTELARLEVEPSKRSLRFRFLKVQKTERGVGMFEPSELRIFGERHEVP